MGNVFCNGSMQLSVLATSLVCQRFRLFLQLISMSLVGNMHMGSDLQRSLYTVRAILWLNLELSAILSIGGARVVYTPIQDLQTFDFFESLDIH